MSGDDTHLIGSGEITVVETASPPEGIQDLNELEAVKRIKSQLVENVAEFDTGSFQETVPENNIPDDVNLPTEVVYSTGDQFYRAELHEATDEGLIYSVESVEMFGTDFDRPQPDIGASENYEGEVGVPVRELDRYFDIDYEEKPHMKKGATEVLESYRPVEE